MPVCPGCNRQISAGATTIAQWHARCAPGEIRDAWSDGFDAGKVNAQIAARAEIENLKARNAEVIARIAVIEENLQAFLDSDHANGRKPANGGRKSPN